MTDARAVPQEDGAAVLLPPALVARVYNLLARAAEELFRRDRVRLAADELQLLGVLQDAAAANAARAARGFVEETSLGPPLLGGAQFVTCADAAGRLGISPQWLRSLARRGEIPGSVKRAGVWLVPETEVDLYAATRHRRRGTRVA